MRPPTELQNHSLENDCNGISLRGLLSAVGRLQRDGKLHAPRKLPSVRHILKFGCDPVSCKDANCHSHTLEWKPKHCQRKIGLRWPDQLEHRQDGHSVGSRRQGHRPQRRQCPLHGPRRQSDPGESAVATSELHLAHGRRQSDELHKRERFDAGKLAEAEES